MATISLCMIVKNEEDVLERCLSSVKDIVDEIIIADTGSTDRTKEIAYSFTDQVYDFQWIDDFAAARNFAFSKAEKDYCIWLDADDVILEKDRILLRNLIVNLDDEVDVVMLPYHTAFDQLGKPTFMYYRERIVRNHPRYRWEGEVHEVITPSGTIIHGEPAVTHKKEKPGDGERNLRILEKKKKAVGILPARQQFYYGQELYFNKRFDDAILTLELFMKDKSGWIENKLEACKLLSFCYKAKKNRPMALSSLLKSLELDVPRAELCCEIGAYFLEEEKYNQSAFWYGVALGRPMKPDSGAFVMPDCYGYIPNLQLSVCYDRMGDWQTAEAFNEAAASTKPDSEAVAYNRNYFEKKHRQAQ